MYATDLTSKPNNHVPAHVLIVLCVLMGFASISTDLYLPAMPAMQNDLHVAAGIMEFTISGYLIGFSLTQLLWGPLSDRWGRRLPIAAGLVLFALGSAGCAISHSAVAVISWRMLQAVGACASVVLSRAMVRDLYSGARAAQMMSVLIAVMAIAPIVGPVLGGQIALHVGWRAIFWAQVLIAAVTFAALFTIPETLPANRRKIMPLLSHFAGYGRLVRQKRLMAFAGAGAFQYAGMYAYIAGSPFAFISYFHVPAEYFGFVFGSVTLGVMAANFMNSRLVRRFTPHRILQCGTLMTLVLGGVMVLTTRHDWGGMWGLYVPLFFFVSATGFIVANSIAGALMDHPQEAGSVSALVGAMQYGCGIFGTALVGLFADGTPRPMAWVIGVCAICAVTCALRLGWRRVTA